jgi:hypothetical protein
VDFVGRVGDEGVVNPDGGVPVILPRVEGGWALADVTPAAFGVVVDGEVVVAAPSADDVVDVVPIAVALVVADVVAPVVAESSAFLEDSMLEAPGVGLPPPPRTARRSSWAKLELRLETSSPSKPVAPAARVGS